MTGHSAVGTLALPDGRQAQLWQGGDPAGLPVVFFHGCPDSRLAAVPGDAAARAAGVRLIAVNRPGYGASVATDSDHLSVADDVVALASALGIDRFAVLGMSIGAGYALTCAARHPGRVTSAAVVSAAADVTRLDPPVPRDGLDERGRDFFARLAEVSLEEAIALMRPDFASYVAGVRPGDPDDAALARRFLAGLDENDRRVAAGWGAALIAAQVRESLASPEGYLRDAAVTFRAWSPGITRIACQVHVWHGADDTQHSPRNASWLAAHLPRATLTLLPREGHLGALHRNWPAILTQLA